MCAILRKHKLKFKIIWLVENGIQENCIVTVLFLREQLVKHLLTTKI